MVFGRCQPSLPKSCRTFEGESGRHPSSKKRLFARYQFQPALLEPPCSASKVPRPKLPPFTCKLVPGCLLPSFVCTESAPPSVLRPNTGLDPGIKVASEIAIRGIKSQETTSPNG